MITVTVTNSNNDTSNDSVLLKWKNTVLSILEGESTSKKKNNNNNYNEDDNKNQRQLKVKKLRKLVLLSMQLDEEDKSAKKSFKHTIQTLEMENTIHLDEVGHITINNKKLKKNKNKDRDKDKDRTTNNKNGKKRTLQGDDDNNNENSDESKKSKTSSDTNSNIHSNDQGDDNDGTATKISISNKNEPCPGNPQGVTRLFVGNLSFNINETILEEFLPGLTHVKWITDKESGKFYGSAFIEMSSSKHAADAITNKVGQLLLGRPIKINYAPALPNDKWPPEKKVITGGSSSSSSTSAAEKTNGSTTKRTAGGVGITAMSVKPENCCKLFIGNLSYEITDEIITKFFDSVQAETKAIRWIHHKDTGDFKGVGFVEFWNTEACEKAATLNGKNLLGRPIRIDWTD